MRLAVRLALLVALWLLAWGELSPANILSGMAVGGALFVMFPLGTAGGPRAHASALGIARLGAYVLVQLLLSNLVMARAIARGRLRTRSGVIAHHLTTPSEIVATVMTSIIALSPGTMAVDVDDDASLVKIHFFDLTDPDGAHASLARLERLVTNAIRPEGRAPSGRKRSTP